MKANLKKIRTVFGVTQQVLADKLSTPEQTVTQQMIARWESNSSPIPTKYLKDLAIILGCSIPSLLGVDIAEGIPNFKKKIIEQNEERLLYGTLAVSFGRKKEDVHAWPISQTEKDYVLEEMHMRSGALGNSEPFNWICAETLNDRIVFINPRALDSITLISDEAEETPEYEHEEMYRTIRDLIFNKRPSDQELEEDDAPYSKAFLNKCEALINDLGGEDKAEDHFENLYIERINGKNEYLSIEEEGVADIYRVLVDNNGIDPSNLYANLESEGYHKASFHRYGTIRLIEMSRNKWHEMMLELNGEEIT